MSSSSRHSVPSSISAASAPSANAQAIAASATLSALDDILPSAVPTLKVMRLQAPHLGQPSAGALLSSTHLLTSTLLLPDSFGVIHVGETFSAYLGVLNTSIELPVRGLSVAVQLQTPSKRIVLPSRLDASSSSSGSEALSSSDSRDIEPSGGVDAIVSRRLEEVGQHILRVEVGYTANGAKTLRKFYRFNVTVPLDVSETVTRSGDATCLVSITVENVMEKQGTGGGAVTISAVEYEPPSGLVSKRIDLKDDKPDAVDASYFGKKNYSTVQLYDSCGRLEPGDSFRYLFSIEAESEAAALRGIAHGDDLGHASITYHKAMGESGTIFSSAVVCPPTSFFSDNRGSGTSVPNPKFVVHRSGLSVDVAAASAQRSPSRGNEGGREAAAAALDDVLPVTVEPIDPPSVMTFSVPQKVTLLIVNHSSQTMNLQLQMRLPHMNGMVVCGPSFISLGKIPPSGGSCTVDVRFVAMLAGLFSVQGCFIVDLTSGAEVQQPPLFNVFVGLPDEEGNVREQKTRKESEKYTYGNVIEM